MVITEGRRLTHSFDENIASPSLSMFYVVYLDSIMDACFAREPKFLILVSELHCTNHIGTVSWGFVSLAFPLTDRVYVSVRMCVFAHER